jgi:hypothetical protein
MRIKPLIPCSSLWVLYCSISLVSLSLGSEFITVKKQGDGGILEWTATGRLESALSVEGPWVEHITASSPFSVMPDTASTFFRLRLRPAPAFIRGYIAAAPGKRDAEVPVDPTADVFIPGLTVHLLNASSGEPSVSVTTDLSGRFTIPVREGRYRVCWKGLGFSEGCSELSFSIGNENVNIGTVRIGLAPKNGSTVVYGRVKLGDGTIPRTLEPLANINSFATVELQDQLGLPLQTAYVNNFGEYLLPNVPAADSIQLVAKVEGARAEQAIFPEANLIGSPAHQIDLSFENRAPKITSFVIRNSAGVSVKDSTPGSTLTVKAEAADQDGDAIKYKWYVSPGSGTLSDTVTPETTWKLPSTPGVYTVTSFVFDDKGGYAKKEMQLRADLQGTIFSGTIQCTDGTTGAGARVEVNGQLTIAGAEGVFYLGVNPANRYVFNIRKPGYALLSQIYDSSVVAGHWTLTRAFSTTVDPTQPIQLTESRDERNCPGPLSLRLDWKNYRRLIQPQWQDGSNNVVQPFGKLEVPLPGEEAEANQQFRFCGPGLRLEIPPNSLVDQGGAAPVGNVTVQLSTVDLNSPMQMPGDYTVALPGGDTRVMQSYGAGTVEITSGNRRFNLRPGAKAKLSIPIDPDQLATGAALPATIPILFYDEREGVWREDGTAALAGGFYEAEVTHFSAINADLVKVNQSCVRILSPTLPASYNLEFIIPQTGGAAPVRRTELINNAPPHRHVIYNLPSNVNIVLVPIRVDNNIPIGTFVVNTGGAQNPTNPNRPADPYTACATEVTFTELAIPVPSSQFLQGLFTFEASNLTELTASGAAGTATALNLGQATTNYYNQIDPRGKRRTLADFKTVNGFGTPSEIRVVFANSGDLGFGRDMHGAKSGDNVAAYVSNYGIADGNTGNDLQEAIDATQLSSPAPGPFATVAMEYSPIESPPGNPVEFDDAEKVVKFYVYNSAGTELLPAANLDGAGARPIPQLCMVCHGGKYPGGTTTGVPTFNSRADVKLGSHFVPFDLHFFTFAPAMSKASQQAAFKLFNQDIVQHEVKALNPGANPNPNPVIEQVINEMYSAPGDQNENFIVSGWNAQPDERIMYRDVLARSCRICHSSYSFPNSRFDTAAGFITKLGSAGLLVCEDAVMPHSKVTHNLFWTSVNPHQPGIFQTFGDTHSGWPPGSIACGAFTVGGTTPQTFYELNIETIFTQQRNGTSGLTTRCITCHVGSSPAAGLNLTAGSSYGNLVNVVSTLNAPMRRVTPNNTAQSWLYIMINPNPPGTTQMPLGSSKLSGTDISTIQSWINAGATAN